MDSTEMVIAQFAFDFLRELGFRFDPRNDAYIYEGDRKLSSEEVLRAVDRAR